MKQLEIEMKINSEKKHSVRYDAAYGQDDPAITSVYVMKHSLPNPIPQTLKIKIEMENE